MNRRRFCFALAGMAGLAGTGIWLARAEQARQRRIAIEGALATACQKNDSELRGLPGRAREQIRTWFHAPCLNAAAFAAEIISLSFRERLRQAATPEDRTHCIAGAFVRRVVSADAILRCIRMIAFEVGTELDRNWSECRRRVQAQWASRPGLLGPVLPDDFAVRLDQQVQQCLRAALDQAQSMSQLPALSDTIEAIGPGVILALRLHPAVGIPVFMLSALPPLVSFVTSMVANPAADIQTAIAARLAELANTIGWQFESEVRAQILDLHRWQAKALQATLARI